MFGGLYFLIKINDVYSFGKPYFFPIVPFDKVYAFKSLLKGRTKDEKYRTSMLTHKNKVKQGENV